MILLIGMYFQERKQVKIHLLFYYYHYYIIGPIYAMHYANEIAKKVHETAYRNFENTG